MSKAYAHRDGFDGNSHDLGQHLRDVAEEARKKANAACPQDPEFALMAASAGWFHDIGKYRDEFQEYLFGKRRGGLETRHSVFGAAASFLNKLPMAVVLAILGHHAGLHDIGDAQGQLVSRPPSRGRIETTAQARSASIPPVSPGLRAGGGLKHSIDRTQPTGHPKQAGSPPASEPGAD